MLKNVQKSDLQRLHNHQSGHFLYRLASVLFAIGLLSSCGKKLSIEQKNEKAQSRPLEAALSSSVLTEARLIDIPTPVGFSLVKHRQYDVMEHFIYRGSLQLEQVSSFFSQEMERLGWSMVPFITEQEHLVFCTKPAKQCAIAVRPVLSLGVCSTEIAIFVRTMRNKKQFAE